MEGRPPCRPTNGTGQRPSRQFVCKASPILVCGEHEAISFAVLEHRVFAPGLFLRRALKLHPAPLQFLVGLVDVIARVRHRHHRADPFLIALGGEQHHPGLRLRHSQLDPPLFLIEGLIRDDGEPEFVRIKIQGPVLVRDWDADEFDLSNHGEPTLSRSLPDRPASLALRMQKLLSGYRYSARASGGRGTFSALWKIWLGPKN